jgi:hypothetical protein
VLAIAYSAIKLDHLLASHMVVVHELRHRRQTSMRVVRLVQVHGWLTTCFMQVEVDHLPSSGF